jgi:DNA-binding MarR family transcriptional regulator
LTLYLIKRLELAIRAIMDDSLRSYGLTTPQYTALSVLRGRGGLSSAQLARRSFVRPQTMHQMVLSLEERGVIARRRDPENRRVLLIDLTPAGSDLLRQCEPLVREIEEQMLAGMPGKQQAAFRRGLEHGYSQLFEIARPGLATE